MAFRTEDAYDLCGYIGISSRIARHLEGQAPMLSCSSAPGQRASRAQQISSQTTASESDFGLQGDGGGWGPARSECQYKSARRLARSEIGALGEIRTPDPQIRSLVLYPAELRAHGPFFSAKTARGQIGFR